MPAHSYGLYSYGPADACAHVSAHVCATSREPSQFLVHRPRCHRRGTSPLVTAHIGNADLAWLVPVRVCRYGSLTLSNKTVWHVDDALRMPDGWLYACSYMSTCMACLSCEVQQDSVMPSSTHENKTDARMHSETRTDIAGGMLSARVSMRRHSF